MKKGELEKVIQSKIDWENKKEPEASIILKYLWKKWDTIQSSIEVDIEQMSSMDIIYMLINWVVSVLESIWGEPKKVAHLWAIFSDILWKKIIEEILKWKSPEEMNNIMKDILDWFKK